MAMMMCGRFAVRVFLCAFDLCAVVANFFKTGFSSLPLFPFPPAPERRRRSGVPASTDKPFEERITKT